MVLRYVDGLGMVDQVGLKDELDSRLNDLLTFADEVDLDPAYVAAQLRMYAEDLDRQAAEDALPTDTSHDRIGG